MPNPSSRLLWALVALGFLASLRILADRAQRESANRTAQAVVDYRSVADLARSQGLEVDGLLRQYRSLGVGALALDEQTLEDLALQGRARAFRGLDLQDALRSGALEAPPGALAPDPGRVYLVARDAEVAAELEASLEFALGPGRSSRWPAGAAGSRILEVKGDLDVLASTGLGIPPHLARHLHDDLDFALWLRPENEPGASPETLRRRLQTLASLPGVQGLIFAGLRNEAMGYPDQLPAAADLAEELGLRLGVIELPDKVQQKGIETLARRHPDRVVRVMAVPPAQQARLHPETVVAMYSLGCRERNLRVLYLRPYADLVEELPVEEANRLLFAGLAAELGPALGPVPTTFPASEGSFPLEWTLVAAGAGAATALLASLAMGLPAWVAWLLVAVLAAGTLATGVTGILGHPWRALMALGTATVFPALGLGLQFPALDRAAREIRLAPVLATSTRILLAASATSLAGSLMAASFLPETTYMLALDTFRGVKAHSVLVPGLVLGLFLVHEGSARNLVRLLEERVKVWHLLLFLALAVAGAVYVGRTGNDAVVVSDFERALRRWLDAALGVRPRFKEFILGNPALVLAPVLAWTGRRPLVWLAILVAAVGQASLSDTYAHIHTPLPVSLARTALGLGLGWALGMALSPLVARLRVSRPSSQV